MSDKDSTEKCMVFGCQNRRHQGYFVGNMCAPCHEHITTGKVGPTNSFLGKIALLEKIVSRQERELEEMKRDTKPTPPPTTDMTTTEMDNMDNAQTLVSKVYFRCRQAAEAEGKGSYKTHLIAQPEGKLASAARAYNIVAKTAASLATHQMHDQPPAAWGYGKDDWDIQGATRLELLLRSCTLTLAEIDRLLFLERDKIPANNAPTAEKEACEKQPQQEETDATLLNKCAHRALPFVRMSNAWLSAAKGLRIAFEKHRSSFDKSCDAYRACYKTMRLLSSYVDRHEVAADYSPGWVTVWCASANSITDLVLRMGDIADVKLAVLLKASSALLIEAFAVANGERAEADSGDLYQTLSEVQRRLQPAVYKADADSAYSREMTYIAAADLLAELEPEPFDQFPRGALVDDCRRRPLEAARSLTQVLKKRRRLLHEAKEKDDLTRRVMMIVERLLLFPTEN